MYAARMTEEIWQRLLVLRGDPSATSHSPDNAEAAWRLYAPIALRDRPLVLAQVGQSLDGRVATPTGDAQDVSGCDGIAHLHRCRALVDAVVVGVGTVVADDPSLTVRAVPGPNPVRVVIDCNGRIPPNAKMLGDGGAPVLIVQADDAPEPPPESEVVRLARRGGGLHPREILDALAARGLTSILVEGGAKTIARFVDADLVDRLHVSIAPIIIGSGPMGTTLAPVDRLSEARRPKVNVYDIGTDIVFDCDFRYVRRREPSAESENVLVTHTA